MRMMAVGARLNEQFPLDFYFSDHRIFMEAIFVYQHSYKFAVSNEQKTVEDLP